MDKVTSTINTQVSGGFGALASSFIVESLGHMIPWLIFAFAIIILDLITGIVKVVALQEHLRFSKAVRDTMSKIGTYFCMIVVACFFTVASEGNGDVEKGTCIVIYAIEGISIMGNILKTKGYRVDFIGALGVIGKKFGFDQEDAAAAIKEDRRRKKTQ